MSEVKVPEGYKQTKVGVIPEDWGSIKVQDVCDFIVPGRNKPQKFDGDIPWITTPDLIDGRAVFFSRSGLKISKEVAKTVGSKIVPAGSVIMSCVGELGLVAIAGVNIVINQQLHAFLPSKKIDNYFLMYALKDQESYFHGAATKTALPYLNKDNCNATPLPLPSIQEQTAIATALSDVDNLIQSLEKLIAKKEAIKTGTMQQLLTGKTRLPEFATRDDGSVKGFKQTELGLIPEDWELIKLGNYFDFKNGLNKAKEFFGYGTPIVNYMDVYKLGSIDSTNIKGKVSVTTDEQINYSAKKGDVFFTRTSETVEEIGLSSVLESDIDKAVFSGFVLRARQNKEVLKPSFMKYCFRTSSSRKQIQGTASYTTRALTNGKLLSQILVPTPTKPEQTAIASILSDMDTEIQALQQRLDKTKDIKQGMMQQLLTGKVRLAH